MASMEWICALNECCAETECKSCKEATKAEAKEATKAEAKAFVEAEDKAPENQKPKRRSVEDLFCSNSNEGSQH